MARGKKKEELTLEEKLERALVPVEEQPYEVPENWCWTRLNSINQFKSESINPMNNADDLFELYSVPSSEVDYPEIVLGNEIGSTKQLVLKNDVLLCKINPRINRVWYVKKHTDNCLIASSEWIVIRNEMLLPKYLMWCMRAKYFREYMLSNVSGVGGSLMRAQPKFVNMYPIPLPPLQEQQRIVEQIESLFAKLDEAKEKVTEVVESYLVRRATILDFAFTGKLTSEWRVQNNIDNNWSEKTFSEVAVIKSNLVNPGEYKDFPHIAPDNIEKRTGVLLQYNTIAEDKVTSGKHRFYPGQILYSKIRPYLSKVVMVDFDGLCSADMYPIEAKENTRYLWYYMLSDNFLEQASSAGSRSVLPKINQKELSKLLVNIPSIEEQKEIVKILDRLLPYEQNAAENAQVVLEQIEVIKKSILFKAFRGELGTNSPGEESAIKLLKKILVET